MKYMILALSLFMVGCMKDDQINYHVPGSELGTGCKLLQDQWFSDIDQESHDFRNAVLYVPAGEYEYTAPNGTTCGYKNDPSEALRAGIQQLDYTEPGIFTRYVVRLYWSKPIIVQCSNWSSSDNATEGSIYIHMECNKLTACKAPYSANLGVCKTFH